MCVCEKFNFAVSMDNVILHVNLGLEEVAAETSHVYRLHPQTRLCVVVVSGRISHFDGCKNQQSKKEKLSEKLP